MIKTSHVSSRARLGVFTAAVALLLAAAPLGATTEVALHAHRIQWTGKTPLKYHTGLLTPQSFEASISDAGKIEALSVVLDMNSIDVTDLQGDSRAKLTAHLSNEDFFDVPNHPTASFVMKEHRDGHMHGTITIRGVSREIAIPVTVTGDAASGWTLSGAFSFDRYDFNVNYQKGNLLELAKDKIIDEQISLEIELKVAAKA